MREVTPITLNLQAPNVNVIVHAKEGDRAGRFINAKLVDGATAFIPPENAHFVVHYMKADGNGGLYDTMEDNETPAVTLSGNIATIGIAEQALTTQGLTQMELNIYDANATRISAFKFNMIVEETVMPDGEVESTEYFNILTHEIALALQGAGAVETVLNMTVEAETLEPGEEATVEKEHDPDAGTLNLKFGIPKGFNGKTAYQSAVDGGYTGTEAEFNVELAGLNEAASSAAASAAAAAQSKEDIEALVETVTGNVGIDDDYTGTATTWSSSKIKNEIDEVNDEIQKEIKGKEKIIWNQLFHGNIDSNYNLTAETIENGFRFTTKHQYGKAYGYVTCAPNIRIINGNTALVTANYKWISGYKIKTVWFRISNNDVVTTQRVISDGSVEHITNFGVSTGGQVILGFSFPIDAEETVIEITDIQVHDISIMFNNKTYIKTAEDFENIFQAYPYPYSNYMDYEMTRIEELTLLGIKSEELIEENKLNGKVISILGDSISTYDGWIPVNDGHNITHRARYASATPWYNGDVNDTWWKKLIDNVGAKIGINDSWAGSKVSNQSSINTGDVGPDACMAGVTRITNLGSNGTPDIILFYGGTNDAGTMVTIGTFDSTITYTLDIITNVWNDFATAYKDAIMRLQHYYPLSKIVVLLPTYTSSYYTIPNLDRYNEIIKEICDYFGIDYIDLRRCGINYANLSETLGDGIHPTVLGFEMMENYIRSKLRSIISGDKKQNIVFSISNELVTAVNNDRYIKGVTAGKPYNATITGDKSNVRIKMGDVEVTDTVYNATTGVIHIEAVNGNVVINDTNFFVMYTNDISTSMPTTEANQNGYGWSPDLPIDMVEKPINIVKFVTDANSGTLEIGIVNNKYGTEISNVQTVNWNSSNKNEGIVTVILPNHIILNVNKRIVVFPNTKPNFKFKYATGVSGKVFYTRIPTARDEGNTWSEAPSSFLGFDFGYILN